MDFEMHKKDKSYEEQYEDTEKEIVGEFSEKLESELGNLLFSVVLFGSSAKKSSHEDSDIDVFVILNDSEFSFDEELVQSYQIILKKIIQSTSKKLHVTSVR
ncbi:MAG: nucleotidyltransferase domain-containing protein, partial [Candidatus Woesearchaeota archaeon]